jgi:hypothetical protein
MANKKFQPLLDGLVNLIHGAGIDSADLVDFLL